MCQIGTSENKRQIKMSANDYNHSQIDELINLKTSNVSTLRLHNC